MHVTSTATGDWKKCVYVYDVTATDYHNRHRLDGFVRRFFRTRSHLVRKIGAEKSAPISVPCVISFIWQLWYPLYSPLGLLSISGFEIKLCIVYCAALICWFSFAAFLSRTSTAVWVCVSCRLFESAGRDVNTRPFWLLGAWRVAVGRVCCTWDHLRIARRLRQITRGRHHVRRQRYCQLRPWHLQQNHWHAQRNVIWLHGTALPHTGLSVTLPLWRLCRFLDVLSCISFVIVIAFITSAYFTALICCN